MDIPPIRLLRDTDSKVVPLAFTIQNQIESGVTNWRVLEVRPDDLPNPSIVCEQALADGSTVTVVWAWVPEESQALLVTVFFAD